VNLLARGGLGDLRENLDRLSITDRMPVTQSTEGNLYNNQYHLYSMLDILYPSTYHAKDTAAGQTWRR
jgi:hypothetical protein